MGLNGGLEPIYTITMEILRIHSGKVNEKLPGTWSKKNIYCENKGGPKIE